MVYPSFFAILFTISISAIQPALLHAVPLPEQTATAPNEKDLRKFLHSIKDTYGWSPVEGELSYDFFPDGRLHIQGKDGEATMWEGTWKLKGNQLTLSNKDLKTTKTVAATIDGKDLLLDGKRFRRYRP